MEIQYHPAIFTSIFYSIKYTSQSKKSTSYFSFLTFISSKGGIELMCCRSSCICFVFVFRSKKQDGKGIRHSGLVSATFRAFMNKVKRNSHTKRFICFPSHRISNISCLQSSTSVSIFVERKNSTLVFFLKREELSVEFSYKVNAFKQSDQLH